MQTFLIDSTSLFNEQLFPKNSVITPSFPNALALYTTDIHTVYHFQAPHNNDNNAKTI